MRLPPDSAGDPFATVAVRDRVLAAWAASPARFREDANAEEDHTRGGYRDRVIVELAQNAADAAARAGVPGRLHLILRDGVLTAANTGVPLDAAGVEALSTLRASAKRDQPGSAGRFGVGFAAVVAVSDDPSIVSRYAPDAGLRARPPGADAAAYDDTAAEPEAGTARPGTASGPGPEATGVEGIPRGTDAAACDASSGRRGGGTTPPPEASGPDATARRPPPAATGPGGANAAAGPGGEAGGSGGEAAGRGGEAAGPVFRGVCWSVDRTRRAAAAIPALADEVDRRGGHVPVLRLPYALPGDAETVPEGFDTLVRLPLRDADAEALVRRLLDETGPALLLALPALAEVVLDAVGRTRTLRARWNRPPAVTGGGGGSGGVGAPGGVNEPWEDPPGRVGAPGGALIGGGPGERGRPGGPGETGQTGGVDGTGRAVGTVVIDGTTWRTSEAAGDIASALLADRPVEERPFWQVRWAVAGQPRPDDVPAVVHAPTPSDEPLGLPALLIASFPLAPDRRHVAPGPLTDFIVERAAEAYIALLPPDPGLLDLVPGPVATGELDAKIRRAVLARLPDVPLLPIVAGPEATDLESAEPSGDSRPSAVTAAPWPDDRPSEPSPVRPGESSAGRPGEPRAVPPEESSAGRPGEQSNVRPGEPSAVRPGEAYAADVPPLPETAVSRAAPAGAAGGAARGGRQRVLVRGRDAVVVDGPEALPEVLAEVVPGLLPAGWPARHPGLAALGVRRLSLADVGDALAGLDREPAWWRRLYAALDGADRDALAGLPVPLADGRTVRGPRGLLVTSPAGLDALGLRIVHPEAAHPLLLRLGAVEAGPRAVLADPATRAAVAASYDEEDPEPIWHAVLTLARRAALRPGDEPWLAELALPGADGEPYPAGELLLPGAPLADVIADDAPFGVADGDLVARYGADVLEAVGVLRTFALVRAEDVIEPGFHLDDEEEWTARLGDAFVVPEFTAVRDLEFVADWPGALRLLAEPPLRAAVVEPVRVILADGRSVTVPSYTAWWLRRHPVLAGRRPGELRLGDELAGLYDPAPPGLDAAIARALGMRTTVAALLAEPDGPAELLGRMADPARPISRTRLRALWNALARVELDVEPPDRVRALVDGEPEVVPAEDAIVVDRPDALPLLRGQPLLPVPVHVADALELSTAGDEVPGVVGSAGSERPVPAVARQVLPDAPATYVHHERLVVDGQEIPWWYEDGVVHASGDAGLARGLAWACGRWADRLLAEAALRAPEALPLLLAESDLD